MFCSQCGKQPTKQKTRGVVRTINPVTKICSECEAQLTGMSGENVTDDQPIPGIPEEIANKTGAELSAKDIFTIVTSAIQGTNKKIDDLQKNVNDEIETLQNRVKLLETNNEKKDEEISTLKHTVINMQRALNTIDQGERSTKAIVQHLPESEMDGENNEKLVNDVEKIKQICRLMEYNIDDQEVEHLRIERIGREREGIPRMIKIQFQNMGKRDAFVKNSSKMKEAPEAWKKVYVKKDQHPVYVNENNRLRTKMKKLQNVPENANKTIIIKDGKLTVNGTIVDENLFFR